MEPAPRGPAWFLLATFAITLGFTGLFFTAEPGIQGVDAEELVARADDARTFFTLDLAFVGFVVAIRALPAALRRVRGR